MMVNSLNPIYHYTQKVREIANQNGGRINDLFEPTQYINSGKAGFAFRGKTLAREN